MRSGGIGQALDPTAADLDELALDDAAGVEDEGSHASAPLADDGFREGLPLDRNRIKHRP